MERKSVACVVAVLLALFVISGCETVPKKFKAEVSDMKEKVNTLETRVDTVESKTADVERATAEHTQAIEEIKSTKPAEVQTNFTTRSSSAKGNTRTKDIQTALKNAGFYNGMIDGIKGTGTKKAIKEFQRANGLQADGVIGPKTWDLLSKYLSGADAGAAGAGASAGGNDEGIK